MSIVDIRRSRRRLAGLCLAALVLVVCLIVGLVVGIVVTHEVPRPVVAAHQASRRWDVAAEDVLANRPLPQLPLEAAMPQEVTSSSASESIVLPRASEVDKDGIGHGFPGTAEGALAQLAALDEAAMHGADPSVVDRVYREFSWSGAPEPAQSVLHQTATSLRAHAGLPETGPSVTAEYTVTHGFIKGVTDGGRFAVVCVLGELAAHHREASAAAGLGDCQAMRFANGQWRISPTARAADAPNAWPGSTYAVRAGYREVRRA